MKKIVIGIQGEKGSTNEKACKIFAEKNGWKDFEIKYLLSTERVLKELNEGKITHGTFAWASTSGGFVEETKEAVKKYDYKKIDELEIQIDHAILKKDKIEKDKIVKVYSHQHALKRHKNFLQKEFEKVELVEETDTGTAAKKMSRGEYPPNSVAIAPIICAEMYNLEIYMEDIPTNQNYITTIFLVTQGR